MWISWVPVTPDMSHNLRSLQHPAQTVGLPELGFEALRVQLGACRVGVWVGSLGVASAMLSLTSVLTLSFSCCCLTQPIPWDLWEVSHALAPHQPVPTALVAASLCGGSFVPASLHPVRMWHRRFSMFVCTGATETPSPCQNHRSGLLGVSRPCPPLVRVQVLLFTLTNSQQVM